MTKKYVTGTIAGTSLSFDFHCTNSVQVEKLLKEVNESRSTGHDMIPPRLIKASAAAIAEPIADIFNASVAQGCYPSVWKMGQVTPLFDESDEFKKKNKTIGLSQSYLYSSIYMRGC